MSRGLGDVYKRQELTYIVFVEFSELLLSAPEELPVKPLTGRTPRRIATASNDATIFLVFFEKFNSIVYSPSFLSDILFIYL